jgi:ABC-type amino acid transport system permease subunit
MAVTEHLRSDPPKISLVNDPRVRGIVYQVIVAAAVVAFGLWIIHNTALNLRAQNKTTGFDFLFHTSGSVSASRCSTSIGRPTTGKPSSSGSPIRCWWR